MTVKLNGAGNSHARSLISSGKVNKSATWSISADEENELLGQNDWAAYSKWHLGVDSAESENTKAHYKYPFGKGGEVYRSALIAIRQRAGQQDASGIFDAAGKLLEMIDGPDDSKGAAPFDMHSRLVAAPWAILPECLPVVLATASFDARPPRAAAPQTVGSVAVIPLRGVITQRGGWFADEVSLDGFSAQLASAMADDSIGGVVIDVDSPGGSVFGVSQVADEVRAARAQKPVYSVANSMAASAAYWIGSQAGQMYVAPGGQAGSIGVYAAHADMSRALDRAGVKVSLVAAGKYKTEGSPYEPLGQHARDYMQAQVDDYYGEFTRDVARGRNIPVDQVRTGMGEGRVLGANAAKAAGMVDGIATLGQLVGRMQRELATKKAQAARVALARRELDIIGG